VLLILVKSLIGHLVFVVEWTSGGSARSCARGSQWLWRGLRGRAARPALPAARAARESARVSCTAALLCGRRVGARGLGTRLRRASRMVPCVEEIDKPGEAVQSTVLSRGGGFPRRALPPNRSTPPGSVSGCPPGSTTSSNATPRRCVAPSACRTRPSKGCRFAQDCLPDVESRGDGVVCGGVFFGSIPHSDLLKSVARRVVDRRVLQSDQDVAGLPRRRKPTKRGRKTRTTEARDKRARHSAGLTPLTTTGETSTCAGLCWGGRSSALSEVSALALSPMPMTS